MRLKIAGIISAAGVLVVLMSCAVAAWLQPAQDALELLRTGQYEAGLAALESRAPDDPAAREAWTRGLLETGRYQRAAEVAAAASTPKLIRYRAEALARQGRYDDALAFVDEQIAKHGSWPGPHTWRGLLLERRGRRGEAEAAFRAALARASSQDTTSAETLLMAAVAAEKLEQFYEANDLLRDAIALSTEAEYRIAWGDLFERKFNAGEAKTLYDEVLKINPRSPLALVGMARAVEIESAAKSTEMARKALETNPQQAEAHLQLARLAIQDDHFEDAEQSLKKALEQDPELLEAGALSAVNYHFWNKPVESDQQRAKVAAIHPSYGQLESWLGDFSGTKRRVEDAVEHYRKAIELEPKLWDAHAGLGMSLLRLGEDEAGKAALEKAYQGDKFNVWTVNTLRLVDSFKNFDRIDTEHFRMKLHVGESAVLRPLIEPLLERAYKHFAARFGYQPPRTTLEVYPDHEDFAVRTLGLPGLGAFGAAFGRVVAMDSPATRPRGAYNWASTLWHEAAHVFTLGMTDQKVPRWFTEGISMVEERRGGTGWGEQVELMFLQALRDGKLLPIENLNSGFVRPSYEGQLQVSYLQASLVCEYIEEKFGTAKVPAMLQGYKEGKNDAAVFQDVLGTSLKDFDRGFDEHVRLRLAPLLGLAERQGHAGGDDSIAGLQAELALKPASYWIRLRLGEALEKSGDLEQAADYYEQARRMAPGFGHSKGPHQHLADIYERRGDRARAAAALKDYVALQDEDVDAWLKLAGWQDEAGQKEAALESYTMSLYIDPFAAPVYRSLGRLALDLKRPADAVRGYEAALALEKVDRGGAHFDLALAYMEAGRRDEARRQVLRALEVAPGFEKAQELLLKIVKP